MHILFVSPQLTLKKECFATFITLSLPDLLVHLVDVLTEVGVFLMTLRTLNLKKIQVKFFSLPTVKYLYIKLKYYHLVSLMDLSDVLSEI